MCPDDMESVRMIEKVSEKSGKFPDNLKSVQKIWKMFLAYLIFVIFFTLAKFLENKIYTEKRQFFALNL